MLVPIGLHHRRRHIVREAERCSAALGDDQPRAPSEKPNAFHHFELVRIPYKLPPRSAHLPDGGLEMQGDVLVDYDNMFDLLVAPMKAGQLEKGPPSSQRR